MKIKAICVMLLLVLLFTSCVKTGAEAHITAIQSPPFSKSVTLAQGSFDSKGYYTVLYEGDITAEYFEAVSENENIATIEIDAFIEGRYVTFTVTGKSEGEVYIYLTDKSGSVKSDKILVNVKNQPAVSTTENQTDCVETEETEPANTNEVVYITPTGSKYHKKIACAGKNAIETTVSEAMGKYSPCKKCYKQE